MVFLTAPPRRKALALTSDAGGGYAKFVHAVDNNKVFDVISYGRLTIAKNRSDHAYSNGAESE